jgi:hypothetical protein
MKIASYIFFALAGLSALGGISAASFAEEQLGGIFGSGTLFFYGGMVIGFALLGIACYRLAQRQL